MKLRMAVSEIVLGFTVGPQCISFSGCYQTHHTELFGNSGKPNKMEDEDKI